MPKSYLVKSAGLAMTVGAVALLAGALGAQAASINFEDFNYTGSVTRYDSLTDAQNQTNSTGTYSIATATNGSETTLPNARDAYVYADTSSNTFEFGTAWYFTPQADLGTGTDGYGNPNNSDNGFVQLYDDDGSSLSALDMSWDPTLSEFTLNASGTNAGDTEYARLWPAPAVGGASSISGGDFLDYALNLTASFGSPTTTGEVDGTLPDDVSGSFNALFENTGTDPAYNGYYLVSLLFGNGSSAANNNYGAIYAGEDNFSQVVANTSFIAPVPLPGTWLLGGSGFMILGAIGVLKRRRAIA